ncbi:MAG TPA: 3-dehydroquinate synthase [Gemmatimonadaceae bacterium]|nr:3-dehydroquinate synthase [Gemmatimonadaceae bacterium]
MPEPTFGSPLRPRARGQPPRWCAGGNLVAPDTRSVALPGYRVIVSPGALGRAGELVREAAPAYRYAIITDEVVGPLYAQRVAASFGDVRVDVLTVPTGEQHKTRESWAQLTDELLALECGRDTTIVALGGGVVGDLAGFVAATFMRGIPVVQLPTTLLAMIDASVGGKTGVDTPAGKNLVGAFHPPSLVLSDPAVLATLPAEQLRAGLAEAIKHGVIADENYFERTVGDIPALLARPSGVEMLELIARSVEIKADIVTRDEREGGVRKTLNFGHTLGHAIESESGYELLHGEAVAIGMVLESALAERTGTAEPGTLLRVRGAVERAGLPTARPAGMSADRILAATRSDKKARRGMAEFALPKRVGEMAGAETDWAIRIDEDAVLAVLSIKNGAISY